MTVSTAPSPADSSIGSDNKNPLGVFDDPHYAKIAVARAKDYQSAQPFPNIVLDNFLPEDIARELAGAFPQQADESWTERNNANNRRRFQQDETRVPRLLREMLREMNSRQFILFLETLTGIQSLMPDPYFIGGGVHMSTTGDFLKIHADFNWHHKLQAYRRVNALFYLSEEWKPEWQGAIELWDREMTRPVVSTLPLFNRLVVFSTGEHSHHGQRLPNLCPSGAQRKVLNLYYYTSKREDGDVGDVHFTLYRPEASSLAMELGNGYRKTGGDETTPEVTQD
jgi:Rps23 Pro-64 3,4-dihydroxylase Tpa1-like proline 4-hydroxylase